MRLLCDAKKNNYVLTVATLVSRNANELMVAQRGGSGGVYVWWKPVVWCQVVGFVLSVWQKSGFSRREDVFTFNLVKKEVL
jgi:hypothetical protein